MGAAPERIIVIAIARLVAKGRIPAQERVISQSINAIPMLVWRWPYYQLEEGSP